MDYDPIYDVQIKAIDQQISDLKIQLESSMKKEDTIILPNVLNQLGEPLQKNLGPALLIGSLVIGAILLKN